LFFSCLLKKQSSACALAYKNHDKKVEGNSAKQPAFGAACRAFAAWAWETFGEEDFIFNYWLSICTSAHFLICIFAFIQTDDALPINL
jgi:hypothetical protein